MEKEEIEKIIEEKVEKRVQEELNNRNLKNTKQKSADQESRNISRRDFLKKLGVGALGLGALSLPSAQALNLRSNNIQFYGGDGETNVEFEIDSNGKIQTFNDLNMGGSSIVGDPKIGFGGASDPTEGANSSNFGDTAAMYYDTNYIGSYNDYLVFEKRDSSNDPDGGFVFVGKGADGNREEHLRIRRGNIYIPNGDVQIGGNNVLTTADEGSGSGLDADTVDGVNVYVQSSAPSNPDINDIWIDTS